MKAWLVLCTAIVAEVIGTSALKASEGFTKPIPSGIVLAGYGIAFYCLSLTLKVMPIGVAYALWAGVGTVLVALVGWLRYNQPIDLAGAVGIGLIISGVVILNVFSKIDAH